MKNLINILIAAGVVVLAGIIVVVLFLTGILGSGSKPGPAIPDPEPTRSESPGASTTPSPSASAPAPAPATTPPPPPPQGGADIPGSGGIVRVEDYAELEFIPDRSGIWVLLTFDNEDDDPNLALLDSMGNEIAFNDDDAGNYNAIIMIHLDAGTAYTIVAGLYGGGSGTFSVSAEPAEVLAGGGDVVLVQGTKGFSFTPNESCTWEFRTSDNDGDPYLELHDDSGGYIAEDDDSGGNFNALMRCDLIAGTTYCLIARNIGGSSAAFTLTVEPSSGDAGGGDIDVPFVEGVLSIPTVAPFVLPFTPDEGGIWIIYTSNNGDYDPMLELYGPDGNLIAEDDDGWGDRNSIIVERLEGGVEYTLKGDLWDSSSGEFTLNFKPPYLIPAGGAVRVNDITVFVFTPASTGVYTLATSDNVNCDPMVDVYNVNGYYLDGDDDSGGNFNALLNIELQAGETYYIIVQFYGTCEGLCTFTID